MKFRYPVPFLLFAALSGEASSAKVVSYAPYRETPNALLQRACASAKTTPQTEACTSNALAALDAELNRTYQRILGSFNSADTSEQKKLFVAEQRAWIKLRDAAAQTEYQANIEGTIRGTAALTQKISETHARTQKLKRRYLNLFNEEISMADLAGEWRGVVGTKRVLRIAADGACSVTDPGTPAKSGTCARDGISLKMVESSGKTVFDEWIFVETVSFGGKEVQSLQYLHGEGNTTEVLVRE